MERALKPWKTTGEGGWPVGRLVGGNLGQAPKEKSNHEKRRKEGRGRLEKKPLTRSQSGISTQSAAAASAAAQRRQQEWEQQGAADGKAWPFWGGRASPREQASSLGRELREREGAVTPETIPGASPHLDCCGSSVSKHSDCVVAPNQDAKLHVVVLVPLFCSRTAQDPRPRQPHVGPCLLMTRASILAACHFIGGAPRKKAPPASDIRSASLRRFFFPFFFCRAVSERSLHHQPCWCAKTTRWIFHS